MRIIFLTQGQHTKVDDLDYPSLRRHKWMYHPKGYAYRTEWNGGKKRHIFMHNEILGVDRSVDHINGNGLNNQRSNLRLATKSQNGANRPKQKNNSTGYKGVTKDTSRADSPFVAQIWVNGKRYRSSGFPKKRWAAWFYDLAAQESQQEFGGLNFIPFDSVTSF